MERVLITGGTGSLGQKLTERLLQDSSRQEVIIYSRNEANQYLMKKEFPHNNLKFLLGDVRDLHKLVEATKDVDTIIHAAALKHIDLGEVHPEEFIKTNVLGTLNVIKACHANNVKNLIFVSSDKACQPRNLYGMTKAIGEKLVCGDVDHGSKTRMIAVRYGNVAASNGSVIPFFRKLIEGGKNLAITHKDMTRFFITLDEAVDLILFAYRHAQHKEIFIRKAPSFKIHDLAQFMIDFYKAKNQTIDWIGFKSHGEKLHELLVSEDEAARAEDLGQYIALRKHFVKNPLVRPYTSEVITSPVELLGLFEKIKGYKW